MLDFFKNGFGAQSDQLARALPRSADDPIDVSRLARELVVIASHVANLSHKGTNPIFSSTRELLGEIRKTRKLRTRFFADELFADPAWDILLELKHAENEQFRVSISKLCAAAAVPATTALRWIANLVDKGMLIRNDDRLDHRITYISLHPTTSKAMEEFLQIVVERADVSDASIE